MDAYDRLPRELRRWVASAMLPWSAKSVRRAYEAALKKTGDASLALAHLDRIERTTVAKDVRRIWDQDHPFLDTAHQNKAA